MNDQHQLNEASAPSHARDASGSRREDRPRKASFLRLALIFNVLLWFSLSCSGDIGSVMGVDDAALEIAGVRVEPSSLALAVGDSEVLSASYTDEEGNELPEDVTWSSTNPEIAEVNEDGTVEARSPGTAVIFATIRDGEDGSAEVEVLDRDERSGPESSSGSHEPAGFTRITERTFDQAVEDGWTSSGGIDMQMVQDESAPRSPSGVGQIRYPAGSSGGRTPTFTTRSGLESEGYRKLYISFWLKLSENWQGHESGVNKIGFVWMHDKPVVFPTNWTEDGETMRPAVNLQDTPDGSRNLSANMSDVRIRKGEWHHWEIVLVANSGSSRDGEAHWWIDGEKVGEHTDITYGDSGQSKEWQIVAWRPTWGGAGDEVEQEMHMWMDHMYVSGAR